MKISNKNSSLIKISNNKSYQFVITSYQEHPLQGFSNKMLSLEIELLAVQWNMMNNHRYKTIHNEVYIHTLKACHNRTNSTIHQINQNFVVDLFRRLYIRM